MEAKDHTPRLVQHSHARAAVHGEHKRGRFNQRLALAITQRVGSMWCAYVFCVLALISLPSVVRSGDVTLIIAWITQTFIQLVLLPIIIVGQNVQAAASDAIAEADHETLKAVHTITTEIHTINETQSEILARLENK